VLSLLARLQPRPQIKIIRLTDLWKTNAPISEGGDLVEWLSDGVPESWTAEDCRRKLERLVDLAQPADLEASLETRSEAASAAAEAEAGTDDSHLPRINCGTIDDMEGLKTWTPQALDALTRLNRARPRLFQRGGFLVRTEAQETQAAPFIEPFGLDSLRGELDRAARWGMRVETNKGLVTRYGPPSLDIVRDVLALPEYDEELFPPLDMIVESPRYLPEGELVLTPGYHRAGRFYYQPSAELDNLGIPERPMEAQVEQARQLLLGELLVDFPFANEASRANALAVMLLPFVREMIDGPTPNHHFTASTEGTGKGLCAAACAFPSLGREMDLNPQKASEAEWRKALTSAFVSGCTHYVIDNMSNLPSWDQTPMPVDSGTLAMAWTVRYWRDRLLGGNKEVRIKVQTVFMSTGNNVAFSRELERRIVPIELLAPSENPSLRTGFKHDPLIDWARRQRRQLVQACLTLCRHWIAQGMPSGRHRMGSYESYARVLGGILGACGTDTFLANRTRRVVANPEAERWKALVQQWHRRRGTSLVSTADLYELIHADDPLEERFH
jgi:hypothetical protein